MSVGQLISRPAYQLVTLSAVFHDSTAFYSRIEWKQLKEMEKGRGKGFDEDL
jgi:hypothetical protein